MPSDSTQSTLNISFKLGANRLNSGIVREDTAHHHRCSQDGEREQNVVA